MITDLLATLLATQFRLSSQPAPSDPCGLVSSTEIVSALGSKPSPGRKVSPSVDKESGANLSACSWEVGDLFLSIDVAEYSTACGNLGGAQGQVLAERDAGGRAGGWRAISGSAEAASLARADEAVGFFQPPLEPEVARSPGAAVPATHARVATIGGGSGVH